MKPGTFGTPVSIVVGLRFPAQVRTEMEAYRLLVKWPGPHGDAAHAFALKACGAAFAGEIEAETARGLFVAFADKHDLLAPDVGALLAGRREAGNCRHVCRPPQRRRNR